VFLVGSATKRFTRTAAMQLFEEGLVDLDADINQYLDFQIRAIFSEPIKLKHLLTHTAGFEDTPFGFGAANIPTRIWAAGQTLK
jgi:CubicO group peptidase (beta-lactamase class C family)